MIYRPDIKPPMWGPPEAVQYAVRHNAERMGLPIPLFTLGWHGVDVAAGLIGTKGADTKYEHGYHVFNGIDRVGYDYNDLNYFSRGLSGRETTIVCDIMPYRRYSALTICGVDGEWLFGLDFQRPWLATFGANTGTTAPEIPLDQKTSLSLLWDAGASAEFGVDGSYYSTAISDLSSDSGSVFCVGNRDTADTTHGLDGRIYHLSIFDSLLDKNQREIFQAAPYTLLMPVARPFIFDMGAGGGTVNSNFAIQFDINNLIESDFQAVYDVLNLVDSSFAVSYDIFNLTSSDFQTLFDIAGKASSDLQIVYDISGNRVPSDFVVTYDVLEKVNSEMVITFDLLNSVFSDFAPVYDIRQLVNSDFEIVFDLNNLVGSDFTILYDMAGRTFSDFTVRFDLGDVPVVVVRGSGIGLKIGIGI